MIPSPSKFASPSLPFLEAGGELGRFRQPGTPQPCYDALPFDHVVLLWGLGQGMHIKKENPPRFPSLLRCLFLDHSKELPLTGEDSRTHDLLGREWRVPIYYL